jgi:hypothetical protein
MRPALITAGIAALLAVPLGVPGQPQDLSSEQHGAFAFPDETGSSLLSTAKISKPETLQTALCSGERRLTIQFERYQIESANSTHRQAPHNFANTAGTVFRVIGGKIDQDATCFVANDSFLKETTAVPLKRSAEPSRCARDLYPQFESAKSRPVVGCWPIAESPSGTRVVLIEFARRLRYALASLAVIDEGKRMYVDYPADFSGPGADLWRVDDGGEIHREGFEIVVLLKRGSSYFIAVSWSAAEGSSLSLLRADNSSEFEEVVTDSWYRSPL